MNKFLAGALVILLLVVGVQYYKSSGLVLGGSFGERGCTASTTVWSVGGSNARTVAPQRFNRATLMLSAPAYLFYQLDGTVATAANGIILASTTTQFPENFPTRGAVSVLGNGASTTIAVTECIYN